jgi:hypothetical protein
MSRNTYYLYIIAHGDEHHKIGMRTAKQSPTGPYLPTRMLK